MTAPDERPDEANEPADPGAATAAWRRDEQVIGVDRDDNEVGLVSRISAHGPDCSLHRAFMVLLVDEAGRLLLCRRSEHKLLWPLCWADSCAGHPRPGEDVRDAASRRLREELGCAPVLRPIGRFVYKAQFGEVGCEYELCHVFVGAVCDVVPDPAEVAEVGLFDPAQLQGEISERPNDFVPWVGECLRRFPQSAFAAPE